MDEKSLGSRLQAMRIKAGLTQQALCQKAGLSYSTLTKIERGAIKAPSIFTIQSIGNALGVGLDEIIQNTLAAPQDRNRRTKSGVSFVFFDINGCLVRFYHRAFSRLSDISDEPADIIEAAFWHYNDEVCRGDMTMDEFNKAFANAIGVDKLNWVDYYLETVDPIPEMHDIATWASRHYRIGLLSNTMPGLIGPMRAQGLLPDLDYDVIIDSSEVGAIKPEARIYEIAEQRAGCPPNEILLIDDSRTNLMAAEKHGWHVLWFDDYETDDAASRVRSALEFADN